MDNLRAKPARPPIATNNVPVCIHYLIYYINTHIIQSRRHTEVPTGSKKTNPSNRFTRRGPPPVKHSIPVSKYSVSISSSVSPKASASSGFDQFRKNKNMKTIDEIDAKVDISKSKSVETMVSRWKNHPHSEFVSPLVKRTNSATSINQKYRRPPFSNYDNEDDIKTNNNNNNNNSSNDEQMNIRQTPIFLPGIRNRENSISSCSNTKYGDNSPASSLRVSDSDIEKCKIEYLLSNMNESSQCLNNFHHALSVFAKQQVSQSEGFLKLFTNSRKKLTFLMFLYTKVYPCTVTIKYIQCQISHSQWNSSTIY